MLAPSLVAAQQRSTSSADATLVLGQWIALHAPPGEERSATSVIRASSARWVQDDQGNLIRRTGTGSPRRVIACGIDHPGYVVSAITESGYLRLHRAGSAPVHPLWDQSHQAQQILVHSANGVVPGVVAITNGHFSRQHRADTAVANVDQLWVDVGARSRAEVAALGIQLIDPVARDLPAWEYAGHVAGPDASGRAGCAALAAVAPTPVAQREGEMVFVISALRSFGWTGLDGVLGRLGAIDHLTLVTPAPLGAIGTVAVRQARIARPASLANATVDSVSTLSVRARLAGTTMESVRVDDADALRRSLATLAGADSARAGWVSIDVPLVPPAARRDSLSNLAETLRQLADLPGVPSQEFRVRDAVHSMLPAWARSRAVVDSAGNLYVAVGPARDTTVVVAHMDEVAYTVAAIRHDGSVVLTAMGGAVAPAWEGQPALLHFEADSGDSAEEPLRGVFMARDTASVRTPRAMSAWFGLDSTALVARGVRTGQGVTAYKRAQRLGATRFTGRALDDRAGTAALLAALAGLDTTRLDHTVIFAWSTHEEGGLLGSRALARSLGASVRRVYAVDTFVSSDTPLELPTFAFAPLGNGPVLRALDDGSVTSRAERERVLRAARTAGVPVQVGTTHGSTDAGAFTHWGAVGAGLSWPGRYSHSPGEVLDLRDLAALAKLIRGVASQPTR